MSLAGHVLQQPHFTRMEMPGFAVADSDLSGDHQPILSAWRRVPIAISAGEERREHELLCCYG
jgi:molybdopterin biosynthesis enzyme